MLGGAVVLRTEVVCRSSEGQMRGNRNQIVPKSSEAERGVRHGAGGCDIHDVPEE